MKRKDGFVLALTWALLYVPYILQGGWIRDDLALLTSTRGVQLYAQFHGWHALHYGIRCCSPCCSALP
jgi:hypothetical protein